MIIRDNFKQNPEDPHQWFYNYEVGEEGKKGHLAFRFAARKNDGVMEISITAPLVSDPSVADWDRALEAFNSYLKKEVIAREKE